MLTRLIDACLAHRFAVLVAALVAVVGGAVAFTELPFDAYPDTTPVQVTVNVVDASLSATEVEQRLAFPLEQVLAGVPGLATLRSLSRFGFAQVILVFEDGTDIFRARQLVSERLTAAALPEGVVPTLGPLSTGLGEVLHYVLRGDGVSATELRTLHEWVVRPQLMSVAGVAEINTWGGNEKTFEVVVDPDRLVEHDVTLDHVVRALKRNNANAGGGYVVMGDEALVVQGVGVATTPDHLDAIAVAEEAGHPVLLRDLATVREGHALRLGAVTADGQGEVVLGLGFMVMGANSREVSAALEARLEAARSTLPPGVSLEVVYSRSSLVGEVLDTVTRNLLEAALLVIAVLFAFLGSLRAGFIVALAIPLSMLFAFDLMLRFGIAGSLMSLGALDFGLVVDSAVIQVENAERRLAEGLKGRTARQVVRDAVIEVRRPTLFGELIIAIVYLPILTLTGVEGQLFRPMALTVVFALMGSMLLSVTVMPVLASLVLRPRAEARPPLVARLLTRLYRPVLTAALRFRVAVVVVALMALAAAGWLASGLGTEFVPRLREGAVAINTVRLAGVSLEESVRYGTRVERFLLEKFPNEINRIWTRTGSPQVATDPMGLEVSDVFVTFTPRETWTRATTQDELMVAMRAELETLPGMRVSVSQPIEMRMNEITSGVRSDLGLLLFGDDFDVLEAQAGQIRDVVSAIPGAADVSVEALSGLPTLEITVDREAAARYGVDVADVLQVVQALGGLPVGEIREGQRRFGLRVRLPQTIRADPTALARVPVHTHTGARVPLDRVATLAVVERPATIWREEGRRRIVIQANVAGRDLGGFVAEARARIGAEIRLPPGYVLTYGGQFEHLERARKRLAVVVPLALALVLALLYLTYGRIRDVARVFTGIPFAVVGGVVALWLRDLPFSLSAGVGFIALSGVAVLGDMVLVSTVTQLRLAGRSALDAIREGAMTRVRPVLMTGLVAALGFLPMALNTGTGAEVQRPLATVVIGGILSSTLATLVVLPVLYVLFGGGDPATGAAARVASEGPPLPDPDPEAVGA